MVNKNIFIGTKNSHKRHKLVQIVAPIFTPAEEKVLVEPVEDCDSFLNIAIQKANSYSAQFDGWAISSDGGAIIPALSGKEWQPLFTKRFAENDLERVHKLLDLMKDKADRTIEWHEAIAVSYQGKNIFASTSRAMDGVISRSFDPACHQEGIWLCSITDFPSFGNRNYFALNEEEKALTENSWTYLQAQFNDFFTKYFK